MAQFADGHYTRLLNISKAFKPESLQFKARAHYHPSSNVILVHLFCVHVCVCACVYTNKCVRECLCVYGIQVRVWVLVCVWRKCLYSPSCLWPWKNCGIKTKRGIFLYLFFSILCYARNLLYVDLNAEGIWNEPLSYPLFSCSYAFLFSYLLLVQMDERSLDRETNFPISLLLSTSSVNKAVLIKQC